MNKTTNKPFWPKDFIYSETFLQFIEPIPEAVIISNEVGNIMQVNELASLVLGYTRKELLSLTIEDLVPNSIRHKHKALRKAFFNNPRPRYMNSRDVHLYFLHKSGKEIPMEAALFCLQTPNGKLAVNFIRDVSEQKADLDKLKQQAMFDELTSLPNRRFFNQQLKLSLAKAKRSGDMLALIYMDLDQFKLVNDNYGHAFGDKLLIEVSKRYIKALRESDFLARLSGDEFILILYPIENLSAAKKVAERILKILADPIIVDEIPININTSIGISFSGSATSFLDEMSLIALADKAMYKAKLKGGNTFTVAIENEGLLD